LLEIRQIKIKDIIVKLCKKHQQVFYKYKAYSKDTNANIILYKKEILRHERSCKDHEDIEKYNKSQNIENSNTI
jgi:hypothetical protein